MPTTLPRVLVPVSKTVHAVLTKRAKQEGVSVASVARSLMDRAIELDEDIEWARLADEAERDPRPPIALADLDKEIARRRQCR